MSEDKKSLIDLVPDSVDNAVKNITDKPTQNMGITLADIWYLVFGGISQAAEKRKLKYAYALQDFEKELKEKIAKIPEEKLIEPNIHIITKALENAKYCIEEDELRHMFSSLISSSMNKDMFVSPIMVNIVSNLSPINAKTLSYYYKNVKELDEANNKHFSCSLITMKSLIDYLNVSTNTIYNSIVELEHMNLICLSSHTTYQYQSTYRSVNGTLEELENTELSLLGYNICKICLD